MSGATKRLLAVAALLIGVSLALPSTASAQRRYHSYGGYPYPYWQYAPTVTLPPVYAYPPYGIYYWGYYPSLYHSGFRPGAYYYTYPSAVPDVPNDR